MKKGRLWSAGAVVCKGAVATAVSLSVFFFQGSGGNRFSGFFFHGSGVNRCKGLFFLVAVPTAFTVLFFFKVAVPTAFAVRRCLKKFFQVVAVLTACSFQGVCASKRKTVFYLENHHGKQWLHGKQCSCWT